MNLVADRGKEKGVRGGVSGSSKETATGRKGVNLNVLSDK